MFCCPTLKSTPKQHGGTHWFHGRCRWSKARNAIEEVRTWNFGRVEKRKRGRARRAGIFRDSEIKRDFFLTTTNPDQFLLAQSSHRLRAVSYLGRSLSIGSELFVNLSEPSSQWQCVEAASSNTELQKALGRALDPFPVSLAYIAVYAGPIGDGIYQEREVLSVL